MISHVVSTVKRYSASADEHDTACCFLERQDIREEPSIIQNPVMESCVSLQAAQSASLKAVNPSCPVEEIRALDLL